MVVPVLIAAAVAGCSDDKSSKTEASSTAAAASSSTTAAPDASDDDEPGAGVRIPIGETKKVTVPADAVMDIKVPQSWAQATALRCTAVDSSGRNEDLRSTDAKKPETIHGQEWITLWTFSSPPNAEITVGCKDPDRKLPTDNPNPFIRVAPRGLLPN